MVIDPGCQTEKEKQFLDEQIDGNNLKLKGIWLTHMHLDHIFGVKHLKDKYRVKVYANGEEIPYLSINDEFARGMGIAGPEKFDIDEIMCDGKTLQFSDYQFIAYHIPGHSPGSMVYYCSSEKLCFSGDVLFRYSIGRTDLPGGSEDGLINGIRSKLLVLPDDVRVYPGHGSSTTIGEERAGNIYLRM